MYRKTLSVSSEASVLTGHLVRGIGLLFLLQSFRSSFYIPFRWSYRSYKDVGWNNSARDPPLWVFLVLLRMQFSPFNYLVLSSFSIIVSSFRTKIYPIMGMMRLFAQAQHSKDIHVAKVPSWRPAFWSSFARPRWPKRTSFYPWHDRRNQIFLLCFR